MQAETSSLHATIQDLQCSLKRAQEQLVEADKLKVRSLQRQLFKTGAWDGHTALCTLTVHYPAMYIAATVRCHDLV